MVDETPVSLPSLVMKLNLTAKVITADIETLSLWEHNYRRGDVEAIKSSITRFGFGSVLRVWKGTVMAGNHALRALLELKSEGWKPTGAITVKNDSWTMPVLDISHLSEEEATAFAIADNRIQELGESDDDQLGKLLQELQAGDLLTSTGYDDSDLDDLLSKLDQENAIAIVNGQESSEWVGMPEFTPTVKPFDIMIHCETNEAQQELSIKIVQLLSVELALRGETMVGYFPNRERAKTSGIVIDLHQEEVREAA
jgi:hypothetical protein